MLTVSGGLLSILEAAHKLWSCGCLSTGTSFLQGQQETFSPGTLAKTESNYVVYSREGPPHQAKVDTLKEIINNIMNLFWPVVKMIFGLRILFNKRPEDTQLCSITTLCLSSSTSKDD